MTLINDIETRLKKVSACTKLDQNIYFSFFAH